MSDSVYDGQKQETRVDSFRKTIQTQAFVDNSPNSVFQGNLLGVIQRMNFAQRHGAETKEWKAELELNCLEKHIASKIEMYSDFPDGEAVSYFINARTSLLNEDEYQHTLLIFRSLLSKINLFATLEMFNHDWGDVVGRDQDLDDLMDRAVTDAEAVMEISVLDNAGRVLGWANLILNSLERIFQRIKHIKRMMGPLAPILCQYPFLSAADVMDPSKQKESLDNKLDDSEFNKAYTYLLEYFFGQLPALMRIEENKQVLSSLLIYSDKFSGCDKTIKYLEAYSERGKSIVGSAQLAYQHILADSRSILKTFGKSSSEEEVKAIRMTSSDPHNLGQIVYIVMFNNFKVIYKPKDMSSEINLLDVTNLGLLRYFGISTLKMLYMGRDHGYTEFIEHTFRLSQGEAREYYFRVGQIAVFSKVLGMTDLHQDNVMVGKGGKPYLIDAEMCFISHIMHSVDLINTLIYKALEESFAEGSLANSAFLVRGEKVNEEHMETEISRVRKQSYSPGGQYHEDFQRGISTGLKQVRVLRATVLELMDSIIGGVERVRMPLVATGILKQTTLVFHLQITIEEKLSELTKLLNWVRDSLLKKYPGCEIHLVELRKELLLDLERTDIPFFYYSLSENTIYMHETPIAVLKEEDSVSNRLAEILGRFDSITVDDFLKSFFPRLNVQQGMAIPGGDADGMA